MVSRANCESRLSGLLRDSFIKTCNVYFKYQVSNMDFSYFILVPLDSTMRCTFIFSAVMENTFTARKAAIV